MSVNERTPAAEGLEVVVVGSFNPGIFHPEWFLHQKLIDEEEANSADTKVNVVGREIADVHLFGIKILCMNDRLSLTTTNISQEARIQDLAIHIFTTLSHVPVTACGINPYAYYSLNSRSYWHKIGHTLVPKGLIWDDLVKAPGMQTLIIKASRDGDFPGEIYLTVEPSMDLKFDPGLFVRCNYHHSFSKDTLHAGSTDLLLKYLKSEWKTACGMARIMANKIFEKIKPDNE
jgi:hypothetical protein